MYLFSYLRNKRKKGALKNLAKFAEKHMCQNLFVIKLQAWGLAQVFPSEFCQFFKNTWFKEHLRTTASKETLDLCFPNQTQFDVKTC